MIYMSQLGILRRGKSKDCPMLNCPFNPCGNVFDGLVVGDCRIFHRLRAQRDLKEKKAR